MIGWLCIFALVSFIFAHQAMVDCKSWAPPWLMNSRQFCWFLGFIGLEDVVIKRETIEEPVQVFPEFPKCTECDHPMSVHVSAEEFTRPSKFVKFAVGTCYYCDRKCHHG